MGAIEIPTLVFGTKTTFTSSESPTIKLTSALFFVEWIQTFSVAHVTDITMEIFTPIAVNNS